MNSFLSDTQIVFASVTPSERMRIALTGAVVAGLELTGLGLMVPLLERLSGRTDDSPLPLVATLGDSQLIALVLSAFVLRIVVAGLYQWWVLGLLQDTETGLFERLLQQYFAQPFEQQLTGGASDVMRVTRVSATRTIQGVGVGIVNLATEVPAVLAIAAVIGYSEPRLAMGVAAFFLLSSVVFQRVVGRRAERLGTEFESLHGAEYRLLMNTTYKTREILVARAVQVFLGLIVGNREHAASAARRLAMVRESARLYLDAIFVAGLAIVLLSTGVLTDTDTDTDTTITSIGLLAVGAMRALPAVARTLSSLNNIRGALGSLRSTAAYLSNTGQETEGDQPAQGRIPAGAIVASGLTYTYPGRRDPAVSGASFTIEAGVATALVGRSGAGKSTLVDLLLGLLEPQSGSISIGGVRLDRSSIPAWHHQVSIVPQDIAVLDATLKENVEFGRLPADEPRLHRALEQANLLDDAERLPNRLGTVIGTGGVRLSGGQIQRLGLARALYSDPQVLFLDEATSALDAETELAVARCLESLAGTITTVVVAHRLSTVKRCDRVVHLLDGTVCHTGEFEEMYDQCPDFSRMVDIANLLDGRLEPGDEPPDLLSGHDRIDS